MNTRLALATFVILHSSFVIPALAGTRSSTNYTVPTDIADAGGGNATSVNYANDGSFGGITGIATVAAPAETAKSGYIGQLYEVTALQLAATPATINEASIRQLSATQLLDDDFINLVPANSITWNVQTGPLMGISSGGLATADIVYQNTPATAQGTFEGLTGTLGLTVLNTLIDNYGSYASDAINDAWQVQYFGLNNPNAAPTIDMTGTGQNNLFKYIAGLHPLNPASRFITTVGSANPAHTLTLSPRWPDRTYNVECSYDLLNWQPLTGTTTQDNAEIRILTDPENQTRKFYRVKITYP